MNGKTVATYYPPAVGLSTEEVAILGGERVIAIGTAVGELIAEVVADGQSSSNPGINGILISSSTSKQLMPP